jgi:hypothetical protein
VLAGAGADLQQGSKRFFLKKEQKLLPLVPCKGDAGWAQRWGELTKVLSFKKELHSCNVPPSGALPPSASPIAKPPQRLVLQSRPVRVPANGPRLHLHARLRRRSGLGCHRPLFPLFRYLAARHQYRHHHRHVPHGVPDPEHAKPRHVSDTPQTRRKTTFTSLAAGSTDAVTAAAGHGIAAE